ncbi:MAG TPA: DEAD/DEAH box helicase [Bryobacteraceae bacterium]
MNLEQKLAAGFPSTVRDRGRTLVWQGRVRIQYGSDCRVEARVRDTADYGVSLDWQGGVLYAWCDCPEFISHGPCKHLWATILSMGGRGYLTAAPAEKVTLNCGGAGSKPTTVTQPVPKPPIVAAPTKPIVAPLPARKPDLPAPPPPAIPKPPPRPPAWKGQITEISKLSSSKISIDWPDKREVIYVVDVGDSYNTGCLVLRIMSRDRKADGTIKRAAPLALKRNAIVQLPHAEDREIVAALTGCAEGWSYVSHERIPESCLVMHPLGAAVIPRVVRTGRCFLKIPNRPDDLVPVGWDEGAPWELKLRVKRTGPGWAVVGDLCREAERMELASPTLITPGGFVFTESRVAPLAENTPFEWITHLRRTGSIEAAEGDRDELLATLLCSPGLPDLEVPGELRFEEVSPAPEYHLRIIAAPPASLDAAKLRAELSFDYEGRRVPESETSRGFYDDERRRFVRRDVASEKAAAGLLEELGLKYRPWTYDYLSPGWQLAAGKLPHVVRSLVQSGWHIEAEGKIFRRPSAFHIEVASGLDWFELHGSVDYGGTAAKLPALLEALRRGENMVRLGDGTYGVVPEEWLRRMGLLTAAGTAVDDHIRFRSTQAGLLDALLAAQPEARCDAAFQCLRDGLRSFQGIQPAPQPPGFVGALRDYQREGLGWMEFLRRFSFGGCLADDMGVGKTAQVLALFETRRELRAAGQVSAPSLVVVPRSLIFNWKQEAERFTPQLRVLDYTGVARDRSDFAACDVVLTTYGTVRRDAPYLKDVPFDYVVLDEAQAVKNATTESAKAVRLLRGDHRLALSGTPVENHLGELWSMFEFLNPGMLGTAAVFQSATGTVRDAGDETRRMLAHALRPFILRRTKGQVARELPAKTEQTVYCEMEPAQRKLYDELRQHYRDLLLKRIDTEGLAKSKIQVLEALLRLRQAACHPGLLDPKRRNEGSAKLDTLMEQLSEVIDEGHKALVFSQFTSLLSIVRDRLDAAGVVYEYLDGSTVNRQSHVERFQNDPESRLFLISLKAGGLGLNLTAAEYVFLLDPWWNPAVEAQAVDRAHRIGQRNQVFAYRLIARDTVEEKVLELQKSKRDLAAAIIGEDNSLIGNLRREDLELLLS